MYDNAHLSKPRGVIQTQVFGLFAEDHLSNTSVDLSVIGFSCDIDYGANTFTTRGAKGNVIQGSGGNLSFQTVDNTNASGQTPSTRMVIQNGGNVVIGTTTSSNKLFVANGSIAINNSHSFMVGGDNDTAIGRLKNTAGVFNLEADGTRSIRFGSGTNGEVVRIDNTNERVGIGTDSPTTTLSVQGTTNNGINVIGVGTTANRCYVGLNSSNHGQLFVTGSSGQNPSLISSAGADSYISGGNVGIGTTSPTNGKFVINQNSSAASFGGNVCQLFENFNTTDGQMMSIGFRNNNSVGTTAYIDAVAYDQSIGATDIRFSTYSGSEWSSNMVTFQHTGRVGIGTTSPNYNLEIGGTANPKIAIVSNINSATSSLYFGDSDAKDRGQIQYTHFGDFMELKAGGATRLYLESGINTAYTSDGLFNSNATPSYWNHGNAQFKIGYMDNGSGLYSGAYAFNVKSTDGIPVTGREIGAIYINDVSNGRKPLIISNQGRITMDQTNTSLANSNTGWLTIANGTSAYNFYNAYTGTDGGSGCARYRLNNTSPSFFDFYYTTTQVGYITTNGTDIFYANTSDYRLKEDLKSFDGMSLLEQIQVYDFKWKESDNRMYGVVAHELQEVVPQAVVGDKDQEKLQAVDYSKLVPVLIKSIQELEARVKELENN